MEFKHCDEYIEDETQPKCLREFLDWARSPASDQIRRNPNPRLFATYKGRRVRVTMASRFGDVGITRDLDTECGYAMRVFLNDLTEFH